jgi:hypothetical protein
MGQKYKIHINLVAIHVVQAQLLLLKQDIFVLDAEASQIIVVIMLICAKNASPHILRKTRKWQQAWILMVMIKATLL